MKKVCFWGVAFLFWGTGTVTVYANCTLVDSGTEKKFSRSTSTTPKETLTWNFVEDSPKRFGKCPKKLLIDGDDKETVLFLYWPHERKQDVVANFEGLCEYRGCLCGTGYCGETEEGHQKLSLRCDFSEEREEIAEWEDEWEEYRQAVSKKILGYQFNYDGSRQYSSPYRSSWLYDGGSQHWAGESERPELNWWPLSVPPPVKKSPETSSDSTGQ